MLACLIPLITKAISFDQLKARFKLPQDSQKVMQYYIDRKISKKPLSAGGFYVELYKYFNRSNAPESAKQNVLKAMAFLATGSSNEAELNAIMADIQDELDKVQVLVDEEEIDIDDLK
jgi:hypothetical protein